MNKHILAGLVLLLVFGGFLWYLALPSVSGKGIEIRLAPMDPFDPIRGQYLTLRYQITTPPGLDVTLPDYSQVYVVLEPDSEGLYVAKSVHREWPQVSGEQVVIWGEKVGGGVQYRIEYYFIERGSFLNRTITEITAYVKVLPNGRASLIELRHNGETIQTIPRDRGFFS